MSKKLVIVESPAKAKTIGQYLGKDFTVRASYGHVRDLPKSKLGIDVDNEFEVSYQLIPRAKKIVSEIKKELDSSTELYLATDPDREGEAIAWHLAEQLKTKKPIHRISFTEITKSAVQLALAKPREVSKDLVDAQQARRILDRLVGYKLSPLLWKKVYRGLSAGRVQSVAVRLVVEREREIKAFTAREFWTLEVQLKNKTAHFPAIVLGTGASKLEFKTETEAVSLAKKLTSADLSVESIEVSTSKLKPQPPLITSTLQQMAARVCSFSAKKAMKVAQDLYEGIDIPGKGTVGLITYMRTDSHNLADSAKKQAELQISAMYGDRFIPSTPNVFTKKVRGAQEAHEAIRPTDFSITPHELEGKISRDHYRLYNMIWQVATASMMSPAEVETTAVRINSSAGVKLSARGRELTFEGFLKVYPDSEERFESLPELKEGEKLSLKSAEPMQHFTEPPARYSEATLVRELEKRGIGRPSTYAPIMSTIVDRGYVTKKTGRFFPESVADVVTDLLVENFPEIIDYNFTAEMEENLDDIADGKKELVPVLKNFYGPFAKLLAEKDKTIEKKALVEEATDKVCPKCGKPVVIKLGRFGKFYACSGYPECDYRAPFLDDAFTPEQEKQIEAEVKESCPDCGKPLTIKQGRFGTFLGCSDYPKCKFTKPIIISSGVKCPNCGKDLVRKNTKRGKFFWGCSGYPKCKTAFWDEPIDKKCPRCQNILLKKRVESAAANATIQKTMSKVLPKSIQALAEVLSSLPGIGPKSANRLTFYLLGRDTHELQKFGQAFTELKENLTTCSTCQIVAEADPCPICSDSSRDPKNLAVVEEALDVLALEKARFSGRYHVLGGQISPINHIGPDDLTIGKLLERLSNDGISEVILATDPSLEGEATALYIDEQINNGIEAGKVNKDVIVTRLARGLPVGGDLEYADELTLSRALEGRRSYSQKDH